MDLTNLSNSDNFIKPKDIITKSFLSSGKDLILGNIIFKHPSVEEILNINDGIMATRLYWQMVELLICDPYDKMVDLYDNGIDYQNVDSFDVFTLQWGKAANNLNDTTLLDIIKKSLQFFLGNYDFELVQIKEQLFLIDKNSIDNLNCSFVISREVYNIFSEFLFMMNGMSRSDRINPATESDKMILIEDMRDEKNRRLRNPIDYDFVDNYIGILMDKLSFGGNGSVNIFDINKLKIYQLINGYNITMNKYKAGHMFDAIYAGKLADNQVNLKETTW